MKQENKPGRALQQLRQYKVKCICGTCAACKQRAYKRKRRAEGKV